MPAARFCKDCGNKLDSHAQFCSHCGSKVEPAATVNEATHYSGKSPKSGLTTFLLCLLLGSFGAHRFYVGKIGTGILMLLTGGGFGLWYFYDLISIVCNSFTDTQGQFIEIDKNPSAAKKVLMIIGSIFIGFLTLLLTIFVFILLLVGSLSEKAQTALTAIRRGDLDKAYTLTSKDFQKNTSFNNFKKYIEEHPALKENVAASFPEKELKNEFGLLKGYLHLKNGEELPLTILLIKEDNEWKIQGIEINTPARFNLNEPAPSQPSNLLALSQTYKNKEFKFSIHYPNEWTYEQPNPQTLNLSWKEGNHPYYAIINIQVIPTKKAGGIYANVKDACNDLKKQIRENTSKAQFIDEGKAELAQNPSEIQGNYFITTYLYHGQAMKKIQFVLMKNHGDYLYTWSYTADENSYDNDLALAKKIYESWKIE